jgi:uncharacterized membrane protein YcfT
MTRPAREGWADVAKGVCIILVVLWHVVTKHTQHLDWEDADGIVGGATRNLPAPFVLISAFTLSGIAGAGLLPE